MMRWKLIFAFIVILGLGIGAAVAWFQIQTMRQTRDIAQKLELAKNQIDTGNHPRAQANLEQLLADYPKLPQADGVWAMLARSYEITGDHANARRCWQTIQVRFPDSIHVDNALVYIADELTRDGKLREAEKLWDQILTLYQGSDSIDAARLGKAELLYDFDGPLACRDALLGWLDAFPDSLRRARAEELLGRCNLEILYSSELQPGDELYAIKAGDRLETIGRRYKVSPELIQRVNHLRDARTLRVGQRLKIPKTNFSIFVNKSDNTLTLLNDGKFFKRYRVRTGKDDWRTPPGEFHILRKVKNPDWNNPEDGVTYRAGDPKNALGTRWLAFEGSMLGIHGTLDPSTIGQYVSNGCVGLLKEDVEELYDLVPLGTPVKITGKMDSRAQKTTP